MCGSNDGFPYSDVTVVALGYMCCAGSYLLHGVTAIAVAKGRNCHVAALSAPCSCHAYGLEACKANLSPLFR